MVFFFVHKAQEEGGAWVQLFTGSALLGFLIAPGLHSALVVSLEIFPEILLPIGEKFTAKETYLFALLVSMAATMAIYRSRMVGAVSAETGLPEAMARTVSGRLLGVGLSLILLLGLSYLSIHEPVACLAVSLLLFVKPGYLHARRASGGER
jgi:hypothetical protein